MITYICKYTPVELLSALGAQPEEPNDEVTDFAEADALIHSSVCSHAKQLLTVLTQGMDRNAAKDSGTGTIAEDSGTEYCEKCDKAAGKSGREVVFTNCCDSIRRVYDTLMAEKTTQYRKTADDSASDSVAADRSAEFMFMMDLPHNNLDYSVGTYTKELMRLLDSYQAYSGHTFNRNHFLFTWRKSADAWKRLNEAREDLIAVVGARVGRGLLEMLESSLPLRIVDFTCGGVRMIADPPENAEDLSTEELLRAYARTILCQIPCMRMQDISRRKILTDRPNLQGIIYHTIRFCDYYSFEYAALCKEVSIPMLKLESDYTFQSEGQLSTRIQAFRENLDLQHKNRNKKRGPGIQDGGMTDPEKNDFINTTDKSSKGIQKVSTQQADQIPEIADNVYIGIDSGSTSTNCVAIDGRGNLLASEIIRTGARAGDAAERAVRNVRNKLGSRAGRIRRIIATGYGREFITIADGTKTEISCHARGAHSINPKAHTVIDIGGQDSKIICLDDDGNVTNFIMNDKCAAGTGRFLEMMSHTLEMDISEMASRGIKWKKDLTISSVCTVFAESEVVSLIAENNDTDDIIHALAKSVASKTCAMVRRARGKGPFMMTGGVARNHAVAGEIESKLGEKLYIGKDPDLTGAIGAALFAAETML